MKADKIKSIYIKKSRGLIGRIDKMIRVPWLYRLFYKNTFYLLRNDFEKAKAFQSHYKCNTNKKEIEYKFWLLWWQGIENSPALVQANYKRLQKIVGKNNVFLITKDNYNEYINVPDFLVRKLKNKDISFTNWSDILRFYLLRDNGGYWIDSTVVVSKKFLQYIKQNTNSPFFSVAYSIKDYHWISYAQWTGWFMGSVPHFGLFEFGCKFFEIYFKEHDKTIDYFLMDDVIAYYFKENSEFRNICLNNSRNWKPYYWVNNYTERYNNQLLINFYKDINYGIQKLTYKFPSTQLTQDNFISYLCKNLSNIK